MLAMAKLHISARTFHCALLLAFHLLSKGVVTSDASGPALPSKRSRPWCTDRPGTSGREQQSFSRSSHDRVQRQEQGQGPATKGMTAPRIELRTLSEH
jgi:hypothetical protein